MQLFSLILLCHFHCDLIWILIQGFLLSHVLQICVICKQIHGSCTQCSRCSTYYHAMCASRAGYRMEVRFLSFFVCFHYCSVLLTYKREYFLLNSYFVSLFWFLKLLHLLSLVLIILVNGIANKCSPYMQLHSLEKNGKQITKMVSYCAYHR
jgi:hypothetical protein